MLLIFEIVQVFCVCYDEPSLVRLGKLQTLHFFDRVENFRVNLSDFFCFWGISPFVFQLVQ